MDKDRVINEYYAAMRKGVAAEEQLVALFAADATYIEPFVSPQPAVGIDQIRDRFRKGWETPLPNMELDVLSVEVDGTTSRTSWECRSPALPGPVRGEDVYEILDGKIVRLEVRIVGGV